MSKVTFETELKMCIRDRFKSQPELEILCLNSRESFANNTRYLEARIGEEENPYIADLLEKDKAHLGSVQLQTATAREFVLAVRLEAVREKEKYPYLARVEKLIRDQGFDVRRADLALIHRFPLYDLGACVCQKAFPLIRVALIDNIGDRRIQNAIS